MISGTITDASGRTLSGQTVEHALDDGQVAIASVGALDHLPRRLGGTGVADRPLHQLDPRPGVIDTPLELFLEPITPGAVSR